MEQIPLGEVQLSVKLAIRFGWIIRGHVNVDLAKRALEAVIGRWRVLGARIQGDGKSTPWHLAIPPEFSPSSPALHFTHSVSSKPLEDVYPFSQSSNFSSRIFTKPPLSLFCPSPDISLTFPPHPTTPILYLHLGHYPGLTAVGITTSHAVFDAVAMGLVLREWEVAMRDVDAYIAKGEDKTVVAQLGLRPWLKEDVKLEPGWMPFGWSIPSWSDICWWVVKSAKEYIEDNILGSIENRCMTIPKSFFEKLKTSAHHELAQTYPDGPHFNTSTADVIQAWLWKNVVSNIPDSSALTSFVSIASIRDVLDYIKIPCFNAFVIVNTPALPIRDSRALSLAELSQRSRRALEEQRTPEMLNKSFTWQETKPAWAAPVPLGVQALVLLSNLVKAGTNTIDLRPAVEDGSGDGQVIHSSAVDDKGLTSLVNGFRVQETPDGAAFLIIGRTRKTVWESMRLSVEGAERDV